MAPARRDGRPVAGHPLDVAQVLDEEYRALYEADESEGARRPAPPLPGWLLREDQLVAPDRLVAYLRGVSVVARFFRDRLPEPTRGALAHGRPVTAADMVEGLNQLLRAPTLLYDETTLSEIRLDGDLQALTRGPLFGDDLQHVNRRLLERALPNEIVRIYDVRLRAVYERVHARARAQHDPPRSALCISGGGIRSATFGLGVMQGLAQLGLLDRFDYLSTVSGGGYVGSWFTSWIHRHPEGTPGVMRELVNAQPRSPVTPEPRPVHHLREYSNYLSPQLGMVSADTWTLLGIYLRNLVLNWTVLIPLLVAVLAVPRLILALMLLAPSSGWRWATLVVGFVLLATSVIYATVFRPSLEEHRTRLPSWLGRRESQDWFLVLCLGPLLLSAALLVAYWGWTASGMPRGSDWPVVADLAGLGAGLHVVTWVVAAFLLGRFELRELVVTVCTGLLAGALAGLLATKLLPDAPMHTYAEYYAVLGVPLFIGAFLLAATVFIGLLSRLATDEDREWWARFGAWALIGVVGWLVASALVILGPPLLFYSWTAVASSLSIGTIAGFVAVKLGKSGKTGSGTAGASLTSALMDHTATVAAPIALLVIAVLLSWATTAGIAALDANPWVPILKACRNWPVPAASAPWPLLTQPPRHAETLHCSPPWFVAGAIAGLVLLAFGASRFIDVNKFSLHAMYRARLVRAYLGASRLRRTPNPFTGFDPLDDLPLHEMRDEAFNPGSFSDPVALVARLKEPGPADKASRALRDLLSEGSRTLLRSHVAGAAPSSTLAQGLIEDLNRILDTVSLEKDPAFPIPARRRAAFQNGTSRARRNRVLLEEAYPTEIRRSPPPPRKPLHVINMALNVVGGHKLAWQERKAETFTATELHAGSYHLGYRRAYEYGGESPRGLTLGTAVAISGAAASPNMGYHSSPIVTFLMAMFNARLGWWLGNPGPHGQHTFRLASPRVNILPFLREALGMTDDDDSYVYLSDGGHFENLGLFEMVLRRCHLIVVSDAGCDPKCTLEDLANAIRKVRVDLGVPIEIDEELRIRPRATDATATAAPDSAVFAVATIKYSTVDREAVDGRLIYLKPAFYGREPVDVLNYGRAHAAFPHEPTSDQFFSESQFESYRQLGLHTIRTVPSPLITTDPRRPPATPPADSPRSTPRR